jgi:murein tripeptide amidase MpaA
MSHIISELSQNYRKYDAIFNNYIIKLIPMVNPDGVVVGNSRSSLAGVDLNRRWSNPVPNIHPEIYFLK